MSVPVAIGVYFICWWLAFFIVLPVGVRTQADANSVEPGTADSAPLAPRLWIKALAATVLSAVIFGAVYLALAYGLVPVGTIPNPV